MCRGVDGCRGYRRVNGCGLGEESVVTRVGLWDVGVWLWEVWVRGVNEEEWVCVAV